ncbi:MAG TPA: ATP-binding cassette domain-containing protein [Haloplasmataceae bacterium]
MKNSDQKVLLKVENLEQYFKLGRKYLKAVDNVSFEVYKGEVFGLVGESGCGKTTTGRSIIRLYDITGGSVYFDGTRIAAGTRRYKQAIKDAKKAYRNEVKKYKQEYQDSIAQGANVEEAKAKLNNSIFQSKERLQAIIKENNELISSAIYDHKNINREFALAEMKKVDDKYLPLLEQEKDPKALAKLNKEYKEQLKIAKKARFMNKIQMIFQDPIASLDPRMTVRDIIAEGLIIRGIKDKKYINEQVYKILDLVGLVPEHATRYPHEFSGGQRQRIGVARALILNPELIIADEPISALDVSIQAQIINLLNDLSEKMGLTTIFIAHDLAVVKYFSDRIAVMYYGKIVELAPTDELFKHPLHPYTKSLLSAIPLPDPYFEKKRKRITYNPLKDHDYSEEEPQMREITPGHFILCNSKEFEKYLKEIEHVYHVE